MTVQIAPSMLSADFAKLGDELRVITEGGADIVHLDIMDGHFVPNMTMGPVVIKALRSHSTLPFDCHLMIREPQRYIDAFAEAGADMISIHVEAEPHLHRAMAQIRAAGAKAGIALNPGSSAALVDDILEHADYLLVMSVNPGFGGQKFIGSSIEKIARLRETIARRGLDVLIEVDGGVDVTNAAALYSAGATILVAGSSVLGKPDRRAAIDELRRAALSSAI